MLSRRSATWPAAPASPNPAASGHWLHAAMPPALLRRAALRSGKGHSRAIASRRRPLPPAPKNSRPRSHSRHNKQARANRPPSPEKAAPSRDTRAGRPQNFSRSSSPHTQTPPTPSFCGELSRLTFGALELGQRTLLETPAVWFISGRWVKLRRKRLFLSPTPSHNKVFRPLGRAGEESRSSAPSGGAQGAPPPPLLPGQALRLRRRPRLWDSSEGEPR